MILRYPYFRKPSYGFPVDFPLHMVQELQGSFTVTISSGLVRLGVCAADANFDNLGTDLLGFGYGGTGKMPGSEGLRRICSTRMVMTNMCMENHHV